MIIAVCRLIVTTLDSSSHEQHYARPHGGSSLARALDSRSALSRLVNNTTLVLLLGSFPTIANPFVHLLTGVSGILDLVLENRSDRDGIRRFFQAV